jgi:hypothetical protein
MFIGNALTVAKTLNSSVLGFQVERIVLSTISLNGLGGVSVSKTIRFSDENELTSIFFSAEPSQNILYIPKAWNYPKVDAVLVWYKYGDAEVSRRRAKASVDIICHVQFIQVTIASVSQVKLDNTRSVLNSPERQLWSQAVRNASARVEFSLNWLVADSEVHNIQASHGFNDALENVTRLSAVNSVLLKL